MFFLKTHTVVSAQILFLVLISSLTWLDASGGCVCQLLTCRCDKVKYIPQLDVNATSIILSRVRCGLTKEFMANLTSLPIEELYFYESTILGVENDIFLNFPRLKKLTFDDPDIYIHTLKSALSSLRLTNITKLEITRLELGNLESFLNTLNGTNITELSLIKCKIITFDSTYFFSNLKNLRYLDLKENFIGQASWSYAEHLEVLILSHSNINLPTFMKSDNTSFFPNLTHLEVSVDKIDKIDSKTFKGLDNLESLIFGSTARSTISRDFLLSIPKLKRFHFLAFAYILVPLTVGYDAFKSENLQYLKLEGFQISVDYSGGLFRRTPNLLSLKMERSRIHLIPQMLEEELKPLKKLENLSMTYSALKKVPQPICYMPNLTRVDFEQNHILFWNDTNCPVMSRLKFLSFSENEINLIEQNTFSRLLIANDRLVWDLSLNPFLCNCRLLWFLDWSLQRQDRFLFYPRDYTCTTPPEFEGKIFNSSLILKEQCSSESSFLILVLVPLGSFLLISIGIGSLLYYKRWSIRYLVYLMQSRRKQQKEQEGIHNYSFDAFVCYHNSDLEWLLQELCPKLETENNFSLCIHDRDFIAGWDIVENIVESIEKSRKVLLLLSNQFATSEWCRFEVAMAHQRVIERDENLLVVVLLENITISNQSRRLALLLKQKTYLEWTDDKDGQALFWKRLTECLRAPNVQVT